MAYTTTKEDKALMNIVWVVAMVLHFGLMYLFGPSLFNYFTGRSAMVVTKAQDLWLADCAAMKRPIDDCTLSWSKNGLLRDVYVKKVAP